MKLQSLKANINSIRMYTAEYCSYNVSANDYDSLYVLTMAEYFKYIVTKSMYVAFTLACLLC